MSPEFRVYVSPDIQGIEIGGALKNVVALAAGIADGLGYGDNTKAALITRGIYEIARLGIAMGGRFETFCGLSGIGDPVSYTHLDVYKRQTMNRSVWQPSIPLSQKIIFIIKSLSLIHILCRSFFY